MSDDAFGRMLGSYLAWQTSKHFVRAMLDGSSTPERGLVAGATGARDWFDDEFTPAEKLQVVKQYRPRRARRFRHCSWTRETYPVSELGTVLPETGDLPPSALTGPFLDVVEYLRERLRADESDSYSVRYVDALGAVPTLLAEFPPIVIEPGYLQRSRNVMHRHHGGEWTVTPMPAYIEDGNHRALARVLHTDESEIECFVGRHRWFR